MEDLDMIYNTTDGKTMAGGYSVNSILLNGQQPAMYNDEQLGGKGKMGKVSERFKHLAVPAGLLYINDSTNKDRNIIDETSIINDELYEKLLALAQSDTIQEKPQIRSKKTKRHNSKQKMKKTKRNK
jgi:hypothetical protein